MSDTSSAPRGRDKPFQPLIDAIEVNPAKLHAIWEELRHRTAEPRLRADLFQSRDYSAFLRRTLELADDAGLLTYYLLQIEEARMGRESFREAATAVLGADIFNSFESPAEADDAATEAAAATADETGDWLLRPRFYGDVDALVADMERASARLQAAVDEVSQFTDPWVDARRIIHASGSVCRISIDDKHRGTGVLVRPTLVATAGHVVRRLIRPDATPPTSLAEFHQLSKPDSLKRLKLVFGDLLDALADSPWEGSDEKSGTPAELDPRWLAYYSGPSPNELSDGFDIVQVDDIVSPDGPWDLAIIRLARPPIAQGAGIPALTGEPPDPPFQLHILSHPAQPGQTRTLLKRSSGVTLPLGERKVRLWHNARTLGGSSGAPCLDAEWRIVALHQAGDDVKRLNRAVPIEPWISRVDDILSVFDAFNYVIDVPAIDGDAPQPVIGRRRTQERIDRAARANAPASDRLMIVRGQLGRGKTFTARLIDALLPPGHQRIARDMGNTRRLDAAALAELLLAGVGQDQLTSPQSFTSTDRRVLGSILPQLIDGLAKASTAGGLWLILDDFDPTGLDEEAGVPQLIDGLIGHLSALPELRLVLTGWTRPLPPGFADAIEDLDVPASEPTADDVLDYVKLRIAPAGVSLSAEVEGKVRAVFEALLWEEGPSWHAAPPNFYEQFLATVQPKIDRVLERFKTDVGG